MAKSVLCHRDANLELITFDTETKGFRKGLRCITWCYNHETYFSQNPEDFFNFITERANPDNKLILAAHNLTFDIRYLDTAWQELHHAPFMNLTHARTIMVHGKTYRVPMAGYNIEFKDTLRLLPSSLDTLSKEFSVAHPKIDLIEHAKSLGYASSWQYLSDAPIDDEYIAYAKTDALALYEIMEAYAGYIEEVYSSASFDEIWNKALNSPTAPSMAMSLFKEFHPNSYAKYIGEYKNSEGKKKHARIFGRAHELVREAIHGGRTEKFVDRLKKGYVYDVNSLYPSVMFLNPYPVGKSIYYQGEQAEAIFSHMKKNLGIVNAYVKVPPMHIPPLGIVVEGKLTYPTGTFNWQGTSVELRYAESLGVKILKVHEVVLWTRKSYVYKDYIEHWSKAKEQASREKEEGKRTLAKNFQNQLFGKSIQNPEITKYVTELEDDDITVGKPLIYAGTKHYQVKRKGYAEYYQPQIGCFVTSYARIALHQAMMACEGTVAYCDTDSIITDTPFPDELVSEFELGKWKLEKEFTRAVFTLPKLYFLETEKLVRKGKGFSKEALNLLGYDDYENMLKSIRQKKSTEIETRERPTTAIEYLKTGLYNVKVLKTVRGSVEEKRVFSEDGTSLPKDIFQEPLTFSSKDGIIEPLEEIDEKELERARLLAQKLIGG